MKKVLSMIWLVSGAAIAQEALQETAPEPATQVLPCSAAEHHQFDFWIGEWNVTSDGQQTGTNSVHSILNGCALQENWQGASPGGIRGSSFTLYDRANDKWHQTWVDSIGTLLELDGGLRGRSMILQGHRPASTSEGKTLHRIAWTPNPDGSVRQLWEVSTDGENWTVLFDGLYQKMAGN